jgi:hypothetical protein
MLSVPTVGPRLESDCITGYCQGFGLYRSKDQWLANPTSIAEGNQQTELPAKTNPDQRTLGLHVVKYCIGLVQV